MNLARFSDLCETETKWQKFGNKWPETTQDDAYSIVVI
jgi:hypothetical protein